MGAGRGFWGVIDGACQRSEDLSVLRGKRLAIDLSYWIVQQDAALKGSALKPHIRMTFFRVVYIVAKLGALPIFVIDGEAPALKLQARIDRYRRISGGTAYTSPNIRGGENYPRNAEFLTKVEECVELLDLLGVPVLRAKSEAEALCAELERDGVVDACVTPDSDAFLHGANWVIYTLQADYRNPLMEFCKAADIREHYGLFREHMVALALLVGCDFNNRGVAGIGYAKAIPLVRHFSENQIIDELRKWGQGKYPSPEEIERLNTDEADERLKMDESENQDVSTRLESHCSKCGHPGNKRLHTSQGCTLCPIFISEDSSVHDCVQKVKGFKCNCASCSKAAKKKQNATRVGWWSRIRDKISAAAGFPNEEIIEFFLNREGFSHLANDARSVSELEWRAPNVDQLERFMKLHLHWDWEHTREKTLPLLAHFCLKSMLDCASPVVLIHGKYAPESILGCTKIQGQLHYVVTWKPVDGVFENGWCGLKSECRKSKRPSSKEHFTTEEEVFLLKRSCPELVKKFEAAQDAKKIKKTPKRKAKTKEAITPSNQQMIITPVTSTKTPDIINLDSGDEEQTNSSVRRRLF